MHTQVFSRTPSVEATRPAWDVCTRSRHILLRLLAATSICARTLLTLGCKLQENIPPEHACTYTRVNGICIDELRGVRRRARFVRIDAALGG